MEQQMIELLDQKIGKLYQEIKQLLFTQNSYETPVDTQNVSFYFQFLESSIERHFNRLWSAAMFVRSDDGQISERMYPFAFLTKEIKLKINDICLEATTLAHTLVHTNIDPDMDSLCTEKKVEELRQENR